MLGLSEESRRRRIGVGITGVGLFLVLFYVGSGGLHVWQLSSRETAALPPLADGLVGGVFVAGAACAAIATWRKHIDVRKARLVAAGALVAGQALVVTLVALEDIPPRGPISLVLLLTAALAGLLAVMAPLLGLVRVAHVADDNVVIGLGMGLLAAGHLLLQFPLAPTPPALMQMTIGILVATHVAAAALVLGQRAVPTLAAALVVATLVVVDTGQLVSALGLTGTAWDTATSLGRAVVGAAWICVALTSLRRGLDEDRRRLNTFEHVLAATARDQRERLHELRSTIAGLASGSELLDRADVPADLRDRLWCSLRRELDRMDRLLSGKVDDAADIDLDEALGMILDLQRLKGRHVEFHPHGDVVRARFDALAEVVNILMDNAVNHGGTDRSIVEVVRRDEETVDITVTDFGRGIPEEQKAKIFEWGKRGSDSTGEGIGLNVAQRLMTEDGGSLRLADSQGAGSCFVISLPAARRSPEDDPTTEGFMDDFTMEDSGAWQRSG
jgi:signal transduction histidine kinase